ncbi:MAG TPA: cyclic dehypoxanthinyl futalosine synthase [Thermodesulfovibrionia bacterium]|nr:cyclic dehypoxanthinyl futalosine synthase [Thermodesulfovibrionia bacterium]
MERITKQEGYQLLTNVPLLELGQQADELRRAVGNRDGIVTFVIDRNINYTNICKNKCRFCAFWKDEDNDQAYVLGREDLYKKIEETLELGGTQILIQGGLYRKLNLDFFVDLFRDIKRRYDIHIHGLSPPEVSFLAELSGKTIAEVLTALKDAGLSSIPGGGAEILSDRVRKKVSPEKIGAAQWLEVMEEAHRLGMKTTATMMFGIGEATEDIIEHLDALRALQDRTHGFTAFIPWTFQPGNTEVAIQPATGVEYLRVLALSRIYLDNFPHVQASWVTQGLKMAEVALRFGADDFGSTMIEENVVASTGVSYRVSKEEIIRAIKNAGFLPAQRNTYYEILKVY